MKYRKPLRLKEFDYSKDAYYFITVCTKDKISFFGEIRNEEMVLNKYGRVAYEHWRQIIEHYKMVQLDEFVIMPNHIHGIIAINHDLVLHESNHAVDAYMRPLQKNTGRTKMSLSKIIQQYK